MKAVLISIQPKWCEKIAIGKKTIEVRKTKPSIQTPFKVLIYCTKDKRDAFNNHNANLFLSPKGWQTHSECNGKVIGEFVCDKVISTCGWRLRGDTQQCAKRTVLEEEFPRLACLTIDELVQYAGGDGRGIYGWHISDLKIYDIPKTLSELRTPPCEKSEKACGKCKYLVKIDTPDTHEVDCFVANGREITRPPQSWMYIEE